MTATETAPSSSREVEKLVENLVSLGTTWARYGLTIGRTALETSAKTLSTTAEMLGQLSKRFEEKRSAEAPKA